MTIQSYEIRALDDFGGRIHWMPSDIGAWCPADSVRRLETDMEALRAELAALKAPPKGLSADEVAEAGFYLVRADNINPWVPCIVVRINEEIDELRMLLLGRSEEFSVVGELRPFQMPEVCDAG